jgi:hypothetical protein
MAKAVVYRIQPEDATELTEQELRKAISGQLAPDEDDTIIKHIGIFPSCYSREDTVVLVKFANTPKFLSSLVEDPTSSHFITFDDGVRVEIDRNFTEFTPVNRPDETQGVEAEYV